MTNTYFDHPAEDVLERYLMHRSDEREAELVESHTLACEPCVQRMEALEIQLAATKIALQEFHNQEVAKSFAQAGQRSWRDWFSAPHLSLAGAALALAIAVGVAVPSLRSGAPEQVALSDYRGQEAPAVAKDHTLDVHMNAIGLDQTQLDVQLVSDTGAEIWHGSAGVHDGKVEVDVPRLRISGAYLFRLYAPGSHDELREFAFNVR